MEYIRFGEEITEIRGFGISELYEQKLLSEMYWLSLFPAGAVI